MERALNVYEKSLGDNDPKGARSGQFYQKAGRADRAVKTCKRAIPAMEKTAGSNSKEFGTLLEKCACALLAIGEKREGFGMGIRAQIILHLRAPGAVVGNVLQGHAVFRRGGQPIKVIGTITFDYHL